MSILDYSDDILLVNQAIERLRAVITYDEFNAMIRAMDLMFILELLKRLDCPVDSFIQEFIRTNFDYNKLYDIEGKFIFPLLEVLGYEKIDGNIIPDKNRMWKAGFRNKTTGQEWIRYSSEIEPYRLLRELFLELLKDYYGNQSF